MYTENEETQVGRGVLALRELILKGQFAAGGRLSEPQLVARLGISRTPVCEALSRLVREGLAGSPGWDRAYHSRYIRRIHGTEREFSCRALTQWPTARVREPKR